MKLLENQQKSELTGTTSGLRLGSVLADLVDKDGLDGVHALGGGGGQGTGGENAQHYSEHT